MTAVKDNKYLTTREVAAFLNINEKMVYSLVNEKGLPATKVTGKWLFPRRLVEEWLETHVLNYQRTGIERSSNDGILLMAGSDDLLLQRVLSLYYKKGLGTVFFANLGSMGGLKSLRMGLCHIGTCHLLQDDNAEYNFDFAKEELDRAPVFVNFSKREQGILLQKGNPKGIHSIADLAKKGVKIVNRQLGTGTRLLLDYEIARSDISSSLIDGYQREVARHLDAGIEVLAGRADAAPAIRAVAGLLDLDFLPLRWERYDLLIARERFFEKGIQDFIGLLHEKEFRDIAASYTGYDISLCGKMLFPDNLRTQE
ncbi:MAG: helix-turn-helix transcriptional regulator [Desulfobulbaceae bacterium]|nr:MAG: helix-turn-helix transcriptional regulator [Desulfobulbaceae bacterium]